MYTHVNPAFTLYMWDLRESTLHTHVRMMFLYVSVDEKVTGNTLGSQQFVYTVLDVTGQVMYLT